MTIFDRKMFAGAALLTAALATPAQATWSILIADTRTGEIVIGSATCVEQIDLQLSTPVLISGVGAVTAQSAVDTSGQNRQRIRDRLLQGVPLGAILDELSLSDTGHGNRQYGMIDSSGATLTYSGVQNAAWAGGQTGRIERGVPGPQDDIVYAVQGNILSGGNVVQAAVDALHASAGDLPAMMMEAMQAAKSAGGDGRCSCSNANPTGCGSPPPAPFKSADVGYMLGTRAGDIDAIRGIYPVEGFVGAIGTLDLDGDGFEDMVVGNRDTDALSVFWNTSSAGVPLSSLELAETLTAPSSGAVAMRSEDGALTIAFSSPPMLALFAPDATGSLGLIDSVALPDAPASLSQRGDARLVTIPATNEGLFYTIEDARISLTGSLPLTAAPGGAAVAHLDADDREDLAVSFPGDSSVGVYAGSDSGFTLTGSIPTASNPIGVRAADMDNDGDNELVVLCGSGRAVQIFNSENDGWALWASINIAGTGIGMGVGDMNGDGFPDVVSSVQATNRNLRLWISDGQGGFSLQSRTRVGSAARSVVLADMNNNADLDLVVGNAGDDGLIVLDNPRGGELPQPGRFAAGAYFMGLNVPNQRRSDPDPVDQLQGLYDSWLAGREGRVDAVLSVVNGRSVLLRGGDSAVTLELRDLHGDLLPITDPTMIELGSTGGMVTVSDPAPLEPGVFSFTITGGAGTGTDRLIVRAGAPGDRVELMPRFPVSVADSLADFNGDGACDYFDVAGFIASFMIQDPDADVTGDGQWDFFDVTAYIADHKACAGP